MRTLLIFTTLLAVGTGLLSRKIARKRKELDAVKAILSLGAMVESDGNISDTNATGPRWVREFLGPNFFAEVVGVGFSRVQLEKEGLASLKELPQLVRLRLDNCRLTDDGLQSLQGLTHLQELYLVGTSITDAGLARLKKLTELRGLWLGRTGVTDAGLANLKAMSHLQRLNLASTDVGDAGLLQLRTLMSLEELWLPDGATEEGVQELKKALPLCKIYR